MRSSIRSINQTPLHSTVWMGPRWVESKWVGGQSQVGGWAEWKVGGCVACSDSHVSKCLLLDLNMPCRLLVEDLSTARSWGWPLRSSPAV